MPVTLEGLRAILEKEVDLKDDTLKIALFTSSATITRDTTTYTGLGNEVASGNGYTTGGQTLANVTIAKDTANEYVWADADDVVWNNATFSARYALLYDDTVSAKTALAYYDFGADQSPSASRLTIQPGSSSTTAFFSIQSA